MTLEELVEGYGDTLHQTQDLFCVCGIDPNELYNVYMLEADLETITNYRVGVQGARMIQWTENRLDEIGIFFAVTVADDDTHIIVCPEHIKGGPVGCAIVKCLK